MRTCLRTCAPVVGVELLEDGEYGCVGKLEAELVLEACGIDMGAWT